MSEADYGPRHGGQGRKGRGFFGELKTPDGSVATEKSIGIDFGYGETEIPLLVPTLTPDEVQKVLQGKEDDGIIGKAVEFARARKRAGLPAFALPEEEGLYKLK